ncbi:MAG: YIP1 family protein [Terrimicrobiaceae bacterium]|nr:YIP1 family protein [Terrimicrobiaceae bacterium]
MNMIHINRERQNLGQFTAGDVAAGLRSGRFLPTDLAWRDGMEAWQPLATFTDLPEPESEPDTTPEPPAIPGNANDAAGGDFPWERRGETGFFTALAETITQSLGAPAAAFKRLPAAPDMPPPYLFYLLVSLVAGALYAAESIFFVHYAITAVAASDNAARDPEVAKALVMMKEFSPVWFGFLILVVIPVVPFVSAGIYHLMLMLFGGANESFVKTFAVTCYVLGSISPLQILPCCGSIVMIIWGLIALGIGLSVAHRTDTWRAALAVVIPFVLCCGGYIGLNVLGTLANLSPQ